MNPSTRIKNRATPFSDLLRPRVSDTVVENGVYYENIAGYNGPLADTNVWLALNSGNGGVSIEPIVKTSADILGADPDFYINLTDDISTSYPASISVYVTQQAGATEVQLAPTPFYPSTKTLHGFSNPVDFPNQNIKIFVI